MFINIVRDYNKTLKQQIKEGTSQGWEYIGCFGNCYDKILKFLKLNQWRLKYNEIWKNSKTFTTRQNIEPR